MESHLSIAAQHIVESARSFGHQGIDKKTPVRFHGAMLEMLSGYRMDSEVNVHFEQSTSMTWAIDLSFHAICEHHLLPFWGKAHVFLVPGETHRVPGKSKYARCLEKHARRLTLEERIAEDVADELHHSDAKPGGVMVIVEAEHMCMLARGVKAHGSSTGSCAIRGRFEKPEVRAEALAHLARKV